MTARKPLDPNCDGSIFCPVEGHVIRRWMVFQQKQWFSHIPLTAGQEKTRRERKAAAPTSIRSEPLGASSPRSNPDGSEEDR